MLADLTAFVHDHQPHGQLVGDAKEPGPSGYCVTVACPCGIGQPARDPATGQLLPGRQSLNPAGRPPGIEERFPRNSVKAMDELIAGRILRNSKEKDQDGNEVEVQKSAAEIMADSWGLFRHLPD
jgi:hypothetical protein